MRWSIEVTFSRPLSASGDLPPTPETYVVEAKSWQTALQEARSQEASASPISQLSIELLPDGYRATDPTTKARYLIRKIAADTPLRSGKIPAEASPNTVSNAPVEVTAPAASPAPVSAPVSAPTPVSAPVSVPTESPAVSPVPVSAPPTSTPLVQVVQEDPDALPTFEVVMSRKEQPSEKSSLTYQEAAYSVPPGTSEQAAERLLRKLWAEIAQQLWAAPPGKLVHLAVFNVIFSGRLPKYPLVTLTWKDWRGPHPEIAYPLRQRASKAPPSGTSIPPVSVPANPPPSIPPNSFIGSNKPREVLSSPPLQPPQNQVEVPAESASVEVILATPEAPHATPIVDTDQPEIEISEVPVSTDFAPESDTKPETLRTPTPSAEETATSTGNQEPSVEQEVAITVETSTIVEAKPEELKAETSTAVDTKQEEPKAEASTAVEAKPEELKAETSTAVDTKPEEPKAETSTAVDTKPEEPKAETSTAVDTKPEEPKAETSTAVDTKPEEPKAETSTAVDTKPEEPKAETSTAVDFKLEVATVADPFAAPAREDDGKDARGKVVKRKQRLSGDDLLGDLFEEMHDVHFQPGVLEGAHFVLWLAVEKMPCKVAICHLFDINRREFVIAHALGSSRKDLLLKRVAEKEPLIHQVVHRRRAIVLSGGDARLTGERWGLLGQPVRSAVIAPAVLGGRFLGLLELINPVDGEPFKEGDGYALAYIGEQFAEFLSQRGLSLDPEAIESFTPPKL